MSRHRLSPKSETMTATFRIPTHDWERFGLAADDRSAKLRDLIGGYMRKKATVIRAKVKAQRAEERERAAKRAAAKRAKAKASKPVVKAKPKRKAKR